MEEQSEIYTYLPHDLISDINMQSENTDVETPFERKIICAKNETIKDTKDTNTLCSNIKDKNTNFKLGSLSIDSFDYNSNFFPSTHNSNEYPIQNYFNSNPINNETMFHQFLSKLSSPLANVMMSYPGSQYLQKMLPLMDSSSMSEMLSIIGQNIKDIMCNCYGNYLMQKIIKLANIPQRLFILHMIQPHFIVVAKNISGTHCIQTFIDGISTKEEEDIIKKSIKGNLLDLSFNSNSTHIIQRLISNITTNKRKYLVNFIISHFILLSKNLNGATVIKKFIAEISGTKISTIVLSIIEQAFFDMCTDQYANYVIQYAIDTFGYNQCKSVIDRILNSILLLGLEKYSSNVIDKIILQIKQNNLYQFEKLISFLFFSKSNFNQFNNNKYGQYVLINVIKLMSPMHKSMIKNTLINDIQFCENKCSKVIKYLE